MAPAIPPGLRLECPMCNYKNVFIRKEGLEKHLAHHYKCHPYTCGNCRDRVGFHSEQAVRTHYEQDHDPAEPRLKIHFEANAEDLSNMEKIRLQVEVAETRAILKLRQSGLAEAGGRGQDTFEVVYAKCFREQINVRAQPQQQQQTWGDGMMGQQVSGSASQRAQPFLASCPYPPDVESKPEVVCWDNNLLEHATSGEASSGSIKEELRQDVVIEIIQVQQPVQQPPLESALHPPPVEEISRHGGATGYEHVGLEGIEGQETASIAGNTGGGHSYDVETQTQSSMETPEADLTEQLSYEKDEAAAKCKCASEKTLTNAITEAPSASFRMGEEGQPLLAEEDLAECQLVELASTEQCLANERTNRSDTSEQREKEHNERKELLAKREKEIAQLRKELSKYEHHYNVAIPDESYVVESGNRSEQTSGEKQSLRRTAEKRKRSNEEAVAGDPFIGVPPLQKLRSIPRRSIAAHSSASNVPTYPTKSCLRSKQEEDFLLDNDETGGETQGEVRPRRKLGFKDEIGEALSTIREIELALKEGAQVNPQKPMPRCDLPEKEVANARGLLLPSHDVRFRRHRRGSVYLPSLTTKREELKRDYRHFVHAANAYEDRPLIISRWLIADSLLDRFHQSRLSNTTARSRLSNTWLTRLSWPLQPEWLLWAMEELEKGGRQKHNAKAQFPKQIGTIFVAMGLDLLLDCIHYQDGAIELVLDFYRGLRDMLEFVFDYPSTMHNYGPRSVAKYSKEVEVAPGEPDTDFVEKEVRHVGTRLIAITIPEKGDPHIINAIKEFNKQLRNFVRDDCRQSPPSITPMELLDWARLVEERESRGEGSAMATVAGRIQLLAETLRKEYAVTYI